MNVMKNFIKWRYGKTPAYVLIVRSELFPDLGHEVIGIYTSEKEAEAFADNWVDEFYEVQISKITPKYLFRESVEDAILEELEANKG